MMETLRIRPVLVWISLLILLLILPACSDDGDSSPDGDNSDGDDLDGDELDSDELDGDQEQTEELGYRHCPCFDNATCNVGLVCEEGTCEADPNVTWVRIPGGTFWMGCGGEGTCTPANLAQFSKPRHQVSIPAFEMTQTEVTGQQFYKATGFYPPDYRPNYPAYIDWERTKAVCEALGGRLPSESEWEYAARAGTETDYYCGNDLECLERITWYFNGEYDSYYEYPVGQKEPNAFGLYDMIGNVGELCEDTYQDKYHGAPTDGSAWVVEPTGSIPPNRVVRGSSDTDMSAGFSQGVFKVWLRWNTSSHGTAPIGIRCVRDIQEED